MKFTLEKFIAYLERVPSLLENYVADSIEVCAAKTVNIARAKFGIPQNDAHFTKWAPLAPSTLQEKQRLGYIYNQYGNPLVRRGDLKDSIDYTVGYDPLKGFGFTVGSRDPIMKYQEFGTVRIPPRPVIVPSVIQAIPFVRKEIKIVLKRVLLGKYI